MTDRFRAIEGLALVAALTAIFDGVHPLGDLWVIAASSVSTFCGVSSGRTAPWSPRRRRGDHVSRLRAGARVHPCG
jgi:hypothetical protein